MADLEIKFALKLTSVESMHPPSLFVETREVGERTLQSPYLMWAVVPLTTDFEVWNRQLRLLQVDKSQYYL